MSTVGKNTETPGFKQGWPKALIENHGPKSCTGVSRLVLGRASTGTCRKRESGSPDARHTVQHTGAEGLEGGGQGKARDRTVQPRDPTLLLKAVL